MKCLLLLLCLGLSSAAVTNLHEEPKCNIKTCGTDLLNFSEMSFGIFVRKVQTTIFCIRHCSPPQVHEFFQSITYAMTKRIPGLCSGEDCIDSNRFVALGQCLKNRSFPLIQCGTKLIDLTELALEPVQAEHRANKTCGIIIGTAKCIEENMHICGHKVFSLVREIFGDVLKLGMNVYCHPSYSKEGRSLLTTASPAARNMVNGVPKLDQIMAKPLKHVAKGFKPNGDIKVVSSFFTIFASSAGLLLMTLL